MTRLAMTILVFVFRKPTARSSILQPNQRSG
jgi:hypothetical protein